MKGCIMRRGASSDFKMRSGEQVNQSGASPQCKSKETEVEVRVNAWAEIWETLGQELGWWRERCGGSETRVH